MTNIIFPNGFVQIQQTQFVDAYTVKWCAQVADIMYLNECVIPVTPSVYLGSVISDIQGHIHTTLRRKCIAELQDYMPDEVLKEFKETSTLQMSLNDVVSTTLEYLPDCPGTRHMLTELHSCPILHLSRRHVIEWFVGYRTTDNYTFYGIDGNIISSIITVENIFARGLNDGNYRSCISDLLGTPMLR